MNGFHVAMILLGMICGNLGAVLLPAINLGLFWNTLAGIAGAAAVVFAPQVMGFDPFGPWYVQFLAAGGAGLGVMVIAGALNELRFRS